MQCFKRELSDVNLKADPPVMEGKISVNIERYQSKLEHFQKDIAKSTNTLFAIIKYREQYCCLYSMLFDVFN
jgi:hypothetical protein